MDRLKVQMILTKMIFIFLNLILLLHLIACAWATSAIFELYSNDNWLISTGQHDKTDFGKYLAALYWAVVTVTTVGYGDILPVNKFERGLAICIIVIGVAYYSYVLGNLSFLFSSVFGEESMDKTRERQIKRVVGMYNIPKDITNKMLYFYRTSKSSKKLALKKEYNIDTIIELLPMNLKSQLIYFLYRDPIREISFLQCKDPNFVINYLP